MFKLRIASISMMNNHEYLPARGSGMIIISFPKKFLERLFYLLLFIFHRNMQHLAKVNITQFMSGTIFDDQTFKTLENGSKDEP